MVVSVITLCEEMLSRDDAREFAVRYAVLVELVLLVELVGLLVELVVRLNDVDDITEFARELRIAGRL